MESPTEYYSSLKSDVVKVGALVRGIDSHACTTDLQHLKLHGYVLLCHAIVEQYVERLATAIATDALRKYKETGELTKALLALAVSGLVEEMNSGKKKGKIGDDLIRSIAVFADTAFTKFKTIVDNNNGIKSRNIEVLFKPVGVLIEDVDLGLAAALDALGRERGGIAHSFVIQRELTLSAFQTDLNAIVRDLELLDAAACACLVPSHP